MWLLPHRSLRKGGARTAARLPGRVVISSAALAEHRKLLPLIFPGLDQIYGGGMREWPMMAMSARRNARVRGFSLERTHWYGL